MGYDMLRGNPRPLTQPLDTGFVSPVFDMTKYDENRMTADQFHRIPDSTYVNECTACQLNYKTNIISGADSYKSSLNSLRTLTGDGKTKEIIWKWPIKFNFRASEAYMKTVDETFNLKHVVIDTSATCMVYCAQIRLPLKPTNLDQAFVEAVKLLPKDSSETNYEGVFKAFLKRFGTHVVTSMKTGSLYWQRASFTAANYSRLVEETRDVGIEASAGIHFLGLSGAFDKLSSMDSESATKFQSFAASVTVHSVSSF